MNIQLLDSRRLTGPNLFGDKPGAVLDVAVESISPEPLISGWHDEVSQLMEAIGWNPGPICSRVFKGGVSLVINAPIDVLYTACELNETALNRAIARLTGEPLTGLGDTITNLTSQLLEEQNPALLAMQRAALNHQVPFLWDDDEVSIGLGKSAVTWPARSIPSPESINWQQPGSIPVGLVTGTNGKSTTVRLAASMLAAAGLRAGITSTDYIRVGEEILDHGDYSGPGGARTLLRHPKSEVVVLEVARGGLLRRGLGVERADAALITNIAADHLGEYGINSISAMAEAKFIVRRALGENAPLILNVDDPESVRLGTTLANKITWFGLDGDHPVLQSHLKNRQDAAYFSDGWLILASGDRTRKIIRATDIPITFGGAARYNISNALGAMTLCHVLGVSDEALETGLRNFSGGADVNPGRGNLFQRDGIRVFVDFAHNEHGLRAISEAVRTFHARRYIVLIGQAGDRTNRDIEGFIRAACTLKPGRLMVCELPGYERGRQISEVPGLIVETAIGAGTPKEAISMFSNPLEGVKQALVEARDGDCLVLLALSQRDEVLALIREFVADKQSPVN